MKLLLADNVIDTLPNKVFAVTPNMELLDLTGNGLTGSIRSVEYCAGLTSLLIGNSKVSSIPFVPQLQILDISNTRISWHELKKLQQMPELLQINISGIVLECDCGFLNWITILTKEFMALLKNGSCYDKVADTEFPILERIYMPCPMEITLKPSQPTSVGKMTNDNTVVQKTDKEAGVPTTKASGMSTGNSTDDIGESKHGETGGGLKGEEIAAVEQDLQPNCVAYVMGMCVTAEKLTYILTGAGCVIAMLFLAVIAAVRRYGRGRDTFAPPLRQSTADDVFITNYPGDVTLGLKKYAPHFTWLRTNYANRLSASLSNLTDDNESDSHSGYTPGFKPGCSSFVYKGNSDEILSEAGPSHPRTERTTSVDSDFLGKSVSFQDQNVQESVESNYIYSPSSVHSDNHI